MLLPRYGWAFVHVPRTGGSSIRHALQATGGMRGGMRKHLPAHEIRKRYPGIRMFGFVRNPWERLVSLYAHLSQNERTAKLYDWGKWPSRTFKDWLMTEKPVAESERLMWGNVPPPRQPQSWWLNGCERIGRFEHLQQDFEKVMRAIAGLHLPELQQSNGSLHDDYRQMYDDEVREAVAEWHAADITRWRYVF